MLLLTYFLVLYTCTPEDDRYLDAARPDKIEIVGAAESRIQILRPCHARSPLARPSPGFHAPEFGHRFPDPGFQIPDPGFQIPDPGFQIPDSRNAGYQIPESAIRTHGGAAAPTSTRIPDFRIRPAGPAPSCRQMPRNQIPRSQRRPSGPRGPRPRAGYQISGSGRPGQHPPPADAQKPDPAVAKAALGARRAGAVPHVPESGHRSRPGGGRGRGRRAGSEVRGGRRGEGGRGAGWGRPDTGVISTNERNPGNRP